MSLLEHLNHLNGSSLIGFTKAGGVLMKLEMRSPLRGHVEEIVSYTRNYDPEESVVYKVGQRYFTVSARNTRNGMVQLEICAGVMPMAKVVDIVDYAPEKGHQGLESAPVLFIDQRFADALDGTTLLVDDDIDWDLGYSIDEIVKVVDSLGEQRTFKVVKELEQPSSSGDYCYLTLEALAG